MILWLTAFQVENGETFDEFVVEEDGMDTGT
jgi:hypothetical protein